MWNRVAVNRWICDLGPSSLNFWAGRSLEISEHGNSLSLENPSSDRMDYRFDMALPAVFDMCRVTS